jgi:hypothetical protein
MDAQTATLYQTLAKELAQPGETLLQTGTERAAVSVRTRLNSWLIVGIALAFAAANLLSAWYNNGMYDWEFFWTIITIILLLEGLLLWSVTRAARARRMAPRLQSATPDPPRLTARALCIGALTGDDELAPLLIPPLAPLEATLAHSVVPDTVMVASPDGQLQRDTYIVSGVNVVLWTVLFAEQGYSYFQGVSPLPWQALLSFSVLLLLSLWQLVTFWRRSRRFAVEARADGLYWRSGRRQHHLYWDNMRGWVVLYLPPKNLFARETPSAIYAALGSQESLIWFSKPREGRTEDAGQQLARIVQARVNLPLRNLTAGAMRILGQSQERRRRTRRPPVADAEWDMVSDYFATHLISAVTIGATLVLLIVGLALPWAQQRHFGGQLAQAAIAPSALRDSLTTNALHWTPAPSDDATAPYFAFTPSGYVFNSQTCCDVSSLMARPVGDALVEVTVRQQSDFDLSAVGMLFRANASDHTALAFTITPGGEWHLTQFILGVDGVLTNPRELRHEGLLGGVRSIHQGSDATNRLAVLMRGSSYTFFVNGQFVGGYWTIGMPQSGQVGIYVEGTGGVATFSDLLISPS